MAINPYDSPSDPGIRVLESSSMDQSIATVAATTAIFIGRTLRGPVNTPVLITSMGAFSRRFGGLWSRSSLGPAVQQYFEHGGISLYVVRVANNARGAMLCLPAHHGVLVLRAVEPGSTECVRAAVDYDGIGDQEEQYFNLTVQRVAPDSGHVIDQEIFRRVDLDADSRHFIGDALLGSSLVRLQMPLPASRPQATMGRGLGHTYVDYAQRGTDGSDLSDYDLIGSAAKGTGLFALDQLDRVDVVYLPPPGRSADVGPPALLAAERYCRNRGALLIMDPPASWNDAGAAVRGLRQSGFASSNTLCYFPRIVIRGDDGHTPRTAGGAIAGLLSRIDATIGPWCGLDGNATLKRGLQPVVELDDADVHLLNRAGLNALCHSVAGTACLCGDVTTGSSAHAERQLADLPARRLSLYITTAIERATRWAVFDADGAHAAGRVERMVCDFMQTLADAGAFADAQFGVQCDASPGPGRRLTAINVLLTFRPPGNSEQLSLTLHQTASGCRVASTAFAPVAVA